MAALEALYAGTPPPGGFVIPCLEPVITTDLGVSVDRSNGRMASMPLSGPKTLVSNVCFNQPGPRSSKTQHSCTDLLP